MAATCSRPAPSAEADALPRLLRRWAAAAHAAVTACLAFSPAAQAEAPVACFAEGTEPARIAAVSGATPFGEDGPLAASLSARWFATATNPTTGVEGDPITLTWGVVPDGTPINPFYVLDGESSDASELEASLDSLYGDRATWMALFQQVFQRWDHLSGIRFVYEPADDATEIRQSGSAAGLLSVRPDIRIGGHPIDGNGGIVAYAYRPNTGDIVLDTGDSFFGDQRDTSLRLRNALAHEVGHAIGLHHVCPTTKQKLMEPVVGGVVGPIVGDADDYPDGPQADDIIGANEYYGDALEQDDSFSGANDFGLGIGEGVAILDLSIDSDVDADWNVIPDEPGLRISVTVQPLDAPYVFSAANSGNVGSCVDGSGSLVDTATFQDLAIQLVAANGSTEIVFRDFEGSGGTEVVTDYPVSGGGFVRIVGDGSPSPQLYDLVVQYVPEPRAGLAAGSALATLAWLRGVRRGGAADGRSI